MCSTVQFARSGKVHLEVPKCSVVICPLKLVSIDLTMQGAGGMSWDYLPIPCPITPLPPPSTTWYESELLNPMEVGTENDYQYQYPFMHHYVFYQQDLYLFVRAHTHAQTHMYTNTYICINKKDVHSI